VVALLDELTQQPLEVSLAEHDHVVQQLPAERPDEAFDGGFSGLSLRTNACISCSSEGRPRFRDFRHHHSR